MLTLSDFTPCEYGKPRKPVEGATHTAQFLFGGVLYVADWRSDVPLAAGMEAAVVSDQIGVIVQWASSDEPTAWRSAIGGGRMYPSGEFWSHCFALLSREARPDEWPQIQTSVPID